MITIGQLAKETGFTLVAIRYYEKIGLIQSYRLKNRYRSYTNKDINTLRLIKQSKKLGFSLKEIDELLRLDELKAKGQDIKCIIQKKLSRAQEQILFLENLKKTYQELLKSCDGSMPVNQCPIMKKLKSGNILLDPNPKVNV